MSNNLKELNDTVRTLLEDVADLRKRVSALEKSSPPTPKPTPGAVNTDSSLLIDDDEERQIEATLNGLVPLFRKR
jgi:hypothetical protein